MLGFMMLLLDGLDYALDFMNIDSKLSRRFWRPPRLYVKTLVLKEVLRLKVCWGIIPHRC